MLKENGFSVPTTWEELMHQSQVMQSKGQVKYGYVFQGADYEGATCDFMEFLADAGGKVLNSAKTKSALTANGAALKALTFMQKLVTSGVSPKAVNTYQEAQSMNAFNAGDAAFLRNWDYAWTNSQSQKSKVVGKVGVAPMPTFKGKTPPGYSNIGGWNLYINPHSKNVAADLAFTKFLTGTKAQTALATQFSEIPTNESVRTAKKVIASNPVLAIVPKTKLVPRPAQTPQYPKVSKAIYTNVNLVLAGQKEPKAAVADADKAITNALSGGLG